MVELLKVALSESPKVALILRISLYSISLIYGGIQATTAIVETVIVESTVLVEQTTQFYLLIVVIEAFIKA